jgi:LysM repeat protein
MLKPNPNRPLLRFAFYSTGLLVICLLGLVFLSASPGRPVLAAPLPQAPIYTPTPGADGRIIYIVKANDTLLSISLLTGVPVDQLRTLNNLSGDTIFEGQQLLLGLAGPPEAGFTPGPTPTPTSVLPTPSPRPGNGNLCVLLFDDQNGDSIRQEEEPSIPGGAVSVSNRSGSTSLTENTAAGTEHYCFQEIPEGDYNISVAVPEGYNATTATNAGISLKAGDEAYLDFGAQPNSVTLAEAPVPSGTGRSPILGILGGLLLLGGIGLAIFASRLLKGK